MATRSSSRSPPRRRYRRRSRSRSSSKSRSPSPAKRRAQGGLKRYLGDIVVHDHRSGGANELKSNDPALLACRVFIGNLPTDRMVKSDLEEWFQKYGKVLGCSLFRGYGFVQFETEECARKSVEAEQGSLYKGFRLDVKMAAEGRRQASIGRRRSSPPSRESSFRERSRDRSPFDERRREFRRDDPYERPLPDPRDDPYRRAPPPLHPDDPYLRAPLSRDSLSRDPLPRDPLPRDPLPRDPLRDPYRRDPWSLPPDPYLRDPRDALPPVPSYDRPAAPPTVPERPPYDCVIILQSRTQMNYAEMVERRMKQNMMAVDIQVLLENEAPQVLIEGATRRNIPFAAVINQQNEVHQSITINILHGTPQEHRNMPLDDAMNLVARNFEQFVKKLCEKEMGPPPAKGGIVPPDSQLTYLLNLLADGRHLTLEELDKVKGFVDQRRNRMLEAEGKLPNGASAGNTRNVVTSPPVNPRPAPVRPGAPLSQQLQPADGHKDEVAIIKQQAELQAKILSILNTSSASGPGSSAGMGQAQIQGQISGPSHPHMASGHAETHAVASNNRGDSMGMFRGQAPNQHQSGPPPGQQYGGGGGGGQNQYNQRPATSSGGGGLPLNLDNPSVQKALDNLIQSGPSLMKNINSNQHSTKSMGIDTTGMQARVNADNEQQQMMGRQRGPPSHAQRQRAPGPRHMQHQQGIRMPRMQQQHMFQGQSQAALPLMVPMGIRQHRF